MTESVKNDLFLRACMRKPTPRTPIWIMRQAGRYLPQYRAVRKKADFLTLCKTPELAAEVTVQPVDVLDVDAGIIFSDIMVLPEAMGMRLELIESKGPVLENPVRNLRQVDELVIPDPADKLKYVLDAIALAKRELHERVPLIGFSGAPWTLLSYMVEGEGTKGFLNAKGLIYSDPELAHRLLKKITAAASSYLAAQIEAGADAVQLFDTWAGNLTPGQFEEFSLDYIVEIIGSLERYDVPVIVFAKDCYHSLAKIADSGCDVVGLDWKTEMKTARQIVGKKASLQGNLDPAVLYASPERIRKGVVEVLDGYGNGEGHVFNLGHGILPDVPVENAKALVQIVKEESPKYHSG
jgi:uroporphyrinogen decarboxylase